MCGYYKQTYWYPEAIRRSAALFSLEGGVSRPRLSIDVAARRRFFRFRGGETFESRHSSTRRRHERTCDDDDFDGLFGLGLGF